LKNSEACGPLIAMGSHFDWDEMKQQEFIDAFEQDHADLVRRFRADLGMPKLPWIFTRVSPCFAGMGPGGKKGAKPGPDSGSPGYRTLYAAADSIAKALPPMGVVTTDDFVNNDKAPQGEADTGPEGPMHYTQLGNRKWAERALPLLEKMGAIEAAQKRLEEPVRPWPAVAEMQPRWPVSEDPAEPILAVRGTITTMSTPRTPVQLRPYKDGLVVAEVKVMEHVSAGDPLELDRVLVLLPNALNRAVQPAAAFEAGQELTVILADWDAQAERVHQWPVDNEFTDPTRPLFYALGGLIAGDLRPGKVLLAYRSGKLADALHAMGK
jgi:hypothetical protein